MTSNEWFRNTSWDENVATYFESKLNRTRNKSQYLRLQAHHLSSTHPLIALALLDRYFSIGQESLHAAAHVDRATAHLALGDTESAVRSFESAIKHEATHPGHITNARIDLPYLIAINELSHHYGLALNCLSGVGVSLLVFPVSRFKFHAAKAIILAARNDYDAARPEARAALEAGSQDHSGFRYHPKTGLVSDNHAQALLKLRGLCDA